jgi:SAM-dependent methyltransferase
MLRKLVKNIRQLIKKFTKSSLWFKMTVVVLFILLLLVITNKYKPTKENFIQKKKFEMKVGPELYDKFYASIYNDLVYDEVKNEYEVGEIINATHPTNQSLILDIGSGTGQHVAALNDAGYPTVGLDLSPSMVGIAKKKYPNLKFKQGSALEFMLYPADSFTHILCLYFTIYYIKDKNRFISNCFDWLKPGGYFVLHLVNRDKFDPILNTADPLQLVSAQRYAKKRITNSLIKFKDFKYRGDFKLNKKNNTATFEEIFKDDKTKHIRQNIHKMYMPTQKHILSIAKENGFILLGKIDMVPVQYEYQYLYILQKPE